MLVLAVILNMMAVHTTAACLAAGFLHVGDVCRAQPPQGGCCTTQGGGSEGVWVPTKHWSPVILSAGWFLIGYSWPLLCGSVIVLMELGSKINPGVVRLVADSEAQLKLS